MPPPPLDNPPHFSFDMSGVAGLLGGDAAISAMAIVHVYGNWRWLGWYNTPGSFEITKRLSSFAKSASFHTDPTTLFELDNYKGPKFRAAQSGTVIEETGYLAALFMKECATRSGPVFPGRVSQPVWVTIAELGQGLVSEMHLARTSPYTLLFASVPIAASVSTCALCALAKDWYAFSLILVGIIASGVFCFVLRLGFTEFVFTHPEPATGSPAGDGILGSDKDIVLLRGTEGAVKSITRGRFSLCFSSKGHYNLIRCCSILFFIQFITQLLLIPQASLFGQVMFLASLGVSALYNVWLSPWDKEKIHRELLLKRVLGNPRLTKYTLGSRTAAVVFILFVLDLRDPTRLLNELLPNDTRAWTQWKATISEHLRQGSDHWDQTFLFESSAGNSDKHGFTQQEERLFAQLDYDAKAAYNRYRDYLRLDS